MSNPYLPPGTSLSGRFTSPPDVPTQPIFVMRNPLPPAHTPTPRARVPRKGRSRRLAILCGCMALLVLISGLVVYQKYIPQYHSAMALARSGAQHLQNAEKLLKNVGQGSLDAHSITQARQEFVAAYGSFSQLRSNLEQVPMAATYVPKYGSLLSAALHLVPLAIELSQAGVVGCDALTFVVSHLRGPFNSKGQGTTMGDLTIIKRDVTQLQGLLNTSAAQVNQLHPSDLDIDPRVAPVIATFRTALPKLQRELQDTQTMLNAAPVLLGIGQPTSYLIEQLDSTELRPGGGFIGSYGIATVSGGQITNIHMTDTYLLDKAFTHTGRRIPFPPAYHWFPPVHSWGLRDSNLDADFPTAARYAEQIYRIEGGTVPVQGVIAITPWFIQNALKITGPIYVSEYNETITTQNVVNRIHYHQLNEELKGGDVPSPDGHSSLRKRFTELLFEHFFARVRALASKATPQFMSLFRNALYTKDIQLYLNPDQAEEVLQHFQLASAIQAPAGDSLLVVDANVQGNKANNFITYALHDQVTIDGSGNALHHTTLTYNWPYSVDSLKNNYGGDPKKYTDYIRIYVPPGSVLQAQDGWVPRGSFQAFGREVWAGSFYLYFGRSGTITLTWMVHGAAVKDSNGWHYSYSIQRQAGITWHLNLQMTLPSCAHITDKLGNVTLSSNGTLDRYLSTDSNIELDYTCS